MEILKEEVIVKHNGNTFKRVYNVKTKELSWQLNQSTDEFDIWSTLSEGAGKNLNKEFYAAKTNTVVE